MSNESELNDSGCKDASFDAEMRSFFRDEYGKAKPPDDISVHLIHAIRLYHIRQSRRVSAGFMSLLFQMVRKLAQMPGAIYRFGSRPDTSRLVSGSVLAALLVMAMAPKMVQSLNGSGVGLLYGSQGTTAGQVWSDTFKEKVAKMGLVDDLAEAAPPIDTVVENEQRRRLFERKIGENFDAPEPVQTIEDVDLHPIERGMGPKKPDVPQDTRNRPLTIQW